MSAGTSGEGGEEAGKEEARELGLSSFLTDKSFFLTYLQVTARDESSWAKPASRFSLVITRA